MNEYVQGKVGTPGLLLLVLGVLGIVTNLGLLVLYIVQFALGGGMAVLSSGDMTVLMSILPSLVFQVLFGLLGIVGCIVIAMAGSRLRGARSSGLVYAGSVFAMLPCCSGPCCCIGLPIGAFAIMAMQDDQVKAAFEENA